VVSLSTENDIPRPLKVLQVFWPVVAFAIMGGTYAVAALAKSGDQERRIEALETEGSPAVRERLARIEQSQLNTEQTVDRMEKKLDTALAH
jgi:hypothetical protein